jgi:hypothetical protein
MQTIMHDRGKPIKAAPQVDRLRAQEDLDGQRQGQHEDASSRSSRKTKRRRVSSTPQGTRTTTSDVKRISTSNRRWLLAMPWPSATDIGLDALPPSATLDLYPPDAYGEAQIFGGTHRIRDRLVIGCNG